MNLKQILAGLGGVMAQQVQTENPVADNYVRAFGRILEHASTWAAVSASGVRCATHFRDPMGFLRSCSEGAIAGCVVCQRPTCFHHAMISPIDGTVVCFGCVGHAQRMFEGEGQAEPRERTKRRARIDDDESSERKKHLRTLGLEPDADWDDIERSYKSLVLKCHPDRVSPSERQRATKRMAKINVAFSWLRERKEAA